MGIKPGEIWRIPLVRPRRIRRNGHFHSTPASRIIALFALPSPARTLLTPRVAFDFDTLIDRRGSGSIKFDRRPELDPYWVADMDFASAPVILDAIHQRVDHGVFGYAQAHQGLVDAIVE